MSTLLEAILDKDDRKVRDILADGTEDINIPDDSMTPLMWACQLKLILIINALLGAGADPNWADNEGETALHIATFDNLDDGVQSLLRYQADVNAATIEGKTPLMNAAQSGSRKNVVRLIEAGADVNAKDAMNRTALHWMCAGIHDNPDVAHELIGAGAEVDVKDADGLTPADHAQRLTKPKLLAAISLRH